ncbi:MAG TPA: hypothetical protein VIM16_05775 [Mucilaginibacter sp.]|jgi:hypothetical protein
MINEEEIITYPEPIGNFKEGQWWIEELDREAAISYNLEFKRAVATVHHLLLSTKRQ